MTKNDDSLCTGEGREGQKQVIFSLEVPEMVELALYGLVEVCLFSSLLGFFCRFHREGVFAFLVGAGLEVQESCLFIVVVEFLEYTLFVAFPECICWDSLESVTASWLVLILSSIHFLHSGG